MSNIIELAKFFSNALREDEVVSICTGGIIFTPGSAGTRQEVFQAACQNHYAKPGTCSPMVFFGTQFWKESKVVDILLETSKGLEYHDLIICTDDTKEIAEFLVKIAKKGGLPLNPPFNPKHWVKTKSHSNLLKLQSQMKHE